MLQHQYVKRTRGGPPFRGCYTPPTSSIRYGLPSEQSRARRISVRPSCWRPSLARTRTPRPPPLVSSEQTIHERRSRVGMVATSSAPPHSSCIEHDVGSLEPTDDFFLLCGTKSFYTRDDVTQVDLVDASLNLAANRLDGLTLGFR